MVIVLRGFRLKTSYLPLHGSQVWWKEEVDAIRWQEALCTDRI